MIEYDIDDKNIKRDISFGQWFAKIFFTIFIISAIIHHTWK